MKKFLLKKSVVLGLIILLAACFTAANLFPAIRLFASWWFGAVFLVFLLSLALSTYDQFRIAKAKIRAVPGPVAGGASVNAPVEAFQGFLKQEGYRELAKNGVVVRYGKGSWGYWGNFILHLGMIITVLSCALYAATEHRTIIRAVAGVRIDPASVERPERKGVFSAKLQLPAALVLERIEPTFWENGQTKTLSSELVFFDETGKQERVNVGVSDKTVYHGMKVYQQNEFGALFLLDFRDDAHAFRMPLLMPMPQKRGTAAYGNFDVDNGRYKLKAKYVTDITGGEIMPVNPLLTLRLFNGDTLIGESTLMMNGQGRLGPYTVSLADISLWTDILFDGSRGIAGIFTGFFFLLLGGGLGYFIIPREVVLSKGQAGYSVVWRASKFVDFYRDEEARITAFGREAS
jgi:cytochrome c biogenesis protein